MGIVMEISKVKMVVVEIFGWVSVYLLDTRIDYIPNCVKTRKGVCGQCVAV